jgi:hypothetical protein
MPGPCSIKCGICGSTNCTQENDVGFDINDDGEEKQHIQRCFACKATRFVSDFIRFDGSVGKPYFGKWRKDDEEYDFGY